MPHPPQLLAQVQTIPVATGTAPGRYCMLGDEAIAEGAMAAGCRFYAGYPITPSSEIMELMARRLPHIPGEPGEFIQMEDEIGSIAAIIGASWAGAKTMTATSGPGLSLMLENIGYALITETPCVICDVQRAGPSTGQATRVGQGDMMQIRWGAHGDYEIIALYPWSTQECFDLTVQAFNLAERFRVPVFLMCDEAVGHLRENITIPETVDVYQRYYAPGAKPFEGTAETLVPSMPIFGQGEALLVTGSTHDGEGFRQASDPDVQEALVTRLRDKILTRRDVIDDYETYFTDDAEYLMIAYGFTARSALTATYQLRQLGLKMGLLRLKSIWPFPGEIVRTLSQQVKQVIFPEMNLGQMIREAERYTREPILHYGKVRGEAITPQDLVHFVDTQRERGIIPC